MLQYHKLEADGIILNFGTRNILSSVYLKLETGKIVGLLGRNGEGKSSLFNIIFGTLSPESKSIRIDNQSIFHSSSANNKISYLTQFSFIPEKLKVASVFDDFEINFNDFACLFPELSNTHKQKIFSLSKGNKRLIETYVIIKSKSYFSLLDEPFSNLSPIQVDKIQELLLYQKQYKGFLITDHLHDSVTSISDNLYFLSDGCTYLSTPNNDYTKYKYFKSR